MFCFLRGQASLKQAPTSRWTSWPTVVWHCTSMEQIWDKDVGVKVQYCAKLSRRGFQSKSAFWVLKKSSLKSRQTHTHTHTLPDEPRWRGSCFFQTEESFTILNAFWVLHKFSLNNKNSQILWDIIVMSALCQHGTNIRVQYGARLSPRLQKLKCVLGSEEVYT